MHVAITDHMSQTDLESFANLSYPLVSYY